MRDREKRSCRSRDGFLRGHLQYRHPLARYCHRRCSPRVRSDHRQRWALVLSVEPHRRSFRAWLATNHRRRASSRVGWLEIPDSGQYAKSRRSKLPDPHAGNLHTGENFHNSAHPRAAAVCLPPPSRLAASPLSEAFSIPSMKKARSRALGFLNIELRRPCGSSQSLWVRRFERQGGPCLSFRPRGGR